jgi:aspartyl/glutamyl-tRNA(Asn/Gln) amidotransferase C subunit
MTQIINKVVLKHLAALARIDLNVGETGQFLKDFEKIIGHFKELEKLDTHKIEPMIGGASTQNVLREDDVDLDKRTQSVDDAGHIIRAFPKSEKGYLKIPKVFH